MVCQWVMMLDMQLRAKNKKLTQELVFHTSRLINMISQNCSCQLSKLQLPGTVIKIDEIMQESVHDTFETDFGDIPKLQLPAIITVAAVIKIKETMQELVYHTLETDPSDIPKLSASYQKQLLDSDKNMVTHVGIGLSYFRKIKKSIPKIAASYGTYRQIDRLPRRLRESWPFRHIEKKGDLFRLIFG